MKNREKILVISPQVPEFDKYAGWARLSRMLQMLAHRYEVFFCAEWAHIGYTGKDDKYTLPLKEQGVKLFIADYGLREILLRNRFKLAIIEFFAIAERTLSMIRELQPDLAVVLDTVDVHFLREQTKARLTRDSKDHEEADRVKSRELEVCRSVEGIFTVTSLDKEVLLLEDENLIVEVIPTIHRVVIDGPSPEKRDKSKLLWVGGFNHSPNVDAVRYFCTEVLPRVQKDHPDVEVEVVGDSPPEEIRTLASDKVKILGYVPDTDPYLRTSYISIAPLRYGAGMKGKVAEALSYGLPVVTTSVGVQGLALTHGKDVMVADTPEKFAQCICELMSNRDLYSQLARNGPEFIRNSCTPELVEERLIAFIEDSSQILGSKRCARLRRERCELNFDIFQRYEMAADAIEFLRDGDLKVLDVGGRGDLLRFLPDDLIVSLDRERHFLTRTSTVGDGLLLPFRDKSFDFALSIDMIEHLPRHRRMEFINELGRVASRGIVVGAPFKSSMNDESEAIINEFHKTVYGKENPWLSEHFHHELPDLDEVSQHMENSGFHVSILPNGYLPRWIFVLGLYYFIARLGNSGKLLRKISKFYNKNYYALDNCEPCYRHVLVALREGSPPDIARLYPEAKKAETDTKADLTEALRILPYMETLLLLHEKEELLHETQSQLKECETVVNNLLSKWPVRVYRKLKGMFRT